MDQNQLPNTPLPKLRHSYTVDQKLQSLQALRIKQASNTPNALLTTANELGIHKSLLSKWKKNELTLKAAKNNQSRKISPGRPLKYKLIETSLVDWVKEKRESRVAVSPDNMTTYALKQYPNSFDSFVSCRRWIYQMVDRNNLSIRRKTHNQNTHLSEQEMAEIHLDFVYHICHLQKEHSLNLDCMVNMDETGCQFDMIPSTTVNVKGQKNVDIRTTNNAKGCTVFLACSVFGSKLKPLVVFKGIPNATIDKHFKAAGNGYDPRICCAVQENNYCDARVMELWIDNCYKPYQDQRDGIGLLMMDNFKGLNLYSHQLI